MEGSEARRWFALRVKSNRELLVAEGIRQKGFEEFLPLYREYHRWADRWKLIEKPLFPGYVFCRLDPRLRLPVLTIPGALQFVGIGRMPVPIEDEEIAAIQNVVRSTLPAVPWGYLDSGPQVRFEHGPLAGVKGILLDSRQECRVVVSVALLKQSVAVEIEREWIPTIGAEAPPEELGTRCSRPGSSS